VIALRRPAPPSTGDTLSVDTPRGTFVVRLECGPGSSGPYLYLPDREPLAERGVDECIAWRYSNEDELAGFDDARLTDLLADECDLHGAPRVAAILRTCGLTASELDDQLCFCGDELRRRGRDGLASAVLAFRFDGLPEERGAA
jgi:hypothetical protein